MELRKLTRDIIAKNSRSKLATVSFTRRGIIILSNQALIRLGLQHNSHVDIFQGDLQSEFFISRGTTYQLRRNGSGGAVFSSVDLATMVISKTFTATAAHFNEPEPNRCTFVICPRPVDDEEKKEIYALLRKNK